MMLLNFQSQSLTCLASTFSWINKKISACVFCFLSWPQKINLQFELQLSTAAFTEKLCKQMLKTLCRNFSVTFRSNGDPDGSLGRSRPPRYQRPPGLLFRCRSSAEQLPGGLEARRPETIRV